MAQDKTYILVKNGAVVNRIVAAPDFVPTIQAFYSDILDTALYPSTVDIGHTYDKQQDVFTAPPVVANKPDASGDNKQASIPPGNKDDATKGYHPGSQWFDMTAGRLYVCKDATPSAAFWVPLA